jgi:hypothetical protein
MVCIFEIRLGDKRRYLRSGGLSAVMGAELVRDCDCWR